MKSERYSPEIDPSIQLGMASAEYILPLDNPKEKRLAREKFATAISRCLEGSREEKETAILVLLTALEMRFETKSTA